MGQRGHYPAHRIGNESRWTFRSKTLYPGEAFTHTFPQRLPKASPDSPTKPGMYEYLCEIHPSMRASVTFSESGRKAPTQEELPPRGREDANIQQPLAVPRAGKFLPKSAKIPPFDNLPLLLELVASIHLF